MLLLFLTVLLPFATGAEPALRLALGARRIRFARVLDGEAPRAAVPVHARPPGRRPVDLPPGGHGLPGRDRRPLALDAESEIGMEAAGTAMNPPAVVAAMRMPDTE